MENVKKGVLNKWPFDHVLVNDAPNLGYLLHVML